MKIEHVAFNVAEPKKAAAWYCQHLGMRHVRDGDPARQITFIADDAGTMIEFYHDTSQDQLAFADLHPAVVHVAFVCHDIEATLKRLEGAGGQAAGAINYVPDGDVLAFVRDPWGLTLQLAQRALH